jgi:hypothetical protein
VAAARAVLVSAIINRAITGVIREGCGAVAKTVSGIIVSKKMRAHHATFFCGCRELCMRISLLIATAVILTGCKASEQCSSAIHCAGGSYQACTNGSQCRYLASDGKSFDCNSCTDCMSAAGAAVAWCGMSGGGGAGGGGGGGGVSETAACSQYLSCAAAINPSQVATLIATYGPAGTCWLSPSTASACDSACMMALTQLRNAPNLPAVCNGSGGSGGSGGGGSGGSGGGGSGGSGGGGPMLDMAMKIYQPATVAQMRKTGPGSYELDNVITIARTPSTVAPRLFFQDHLGGDFSAMMGKCSSLSKTPCPQSLITIITGLADGTTVSIKGAYVQSGSFEEFYIDALVVAGAGAMPGPVIAQLADVQRNANTNKWWFQRVSVALGATTLDMFDFSPVEMRYNGTTATGCPAYLGWGMAPSTSADVAGAACSGTTQPESAVAAGSAAPNDELLIGTDFYKTYTYSSDCACAGGFKDTLATATNTLGGTIGGILIGDMVYQQGTIYQYLAPKTNGDAMLQP